jgi:hypothetical protein
VNAIVVSLQQTLFVRLLISDHHVEGTSDFATVIYVAAVGDFFGELLIGLAASRKS